MPYINRQQFSLDEKQLALLDPKRPRIGHDSNSGKLPVIVSPLVVTESSAMQREFTAISTYSLFKLILQPERRFYWLMLVYGGAVSALSLSVPLSVQVLVATVANSALIQQVLVLALILFGLLVLSGLFTAIQVYLMELFERRFYQRVVSEVSLRLLYAHYPYMESINRDELVNRYFDIMTVQKNLPPLLTGALTTSLQILVGIAVTSFYHPAFLIFNAAVLITAYLTFRVFHHGAAVSAIALSTSKYETAKWLENLSRANSFFKSQRTIAYALTHTNDVLESYDNAHIQHFKFTFAQVVGFLILYASTSAALLGVGGWLVILGQLSLGQLIAAELIMVVIFAGLARTGYYLELYYDLYAAMTKLQQLYLTPTEGNRANRCNTPIVGALRFDNVICKLPRGRFHFNLDLPAGNHALIRTRSSTQITAIAELLQGFAEAESGDIFFGSTTIDDIAQQHLRNSCLVVDSTLMLECSIADYLDIASPGIPRSRMRQLVHDVHLDNELDGLKNGIDQALTPYGNPLSVAGVIKLKIAFALAAQPSVLVLTPLFDSLSFDSRQTIMRSVRSLDNCTVLCFSNRSDLADFDDYVLCEFDRQFRFDNLKSLSAALDDALKTRQPHSQQAADLQEFDLP